LLPYNKAKGPKMRPSSKGYLELITLAHKGKKRKTLLSIGYAFC